MYQSGVSASSAWSSQIHQRPPHKHMYPEYIPLEDEHVLSTEEQPLPHVDSPTAESPGYVAESDLEEDPEEYEDDESEDGPIDYPIDGGDDEDDDDDDSSGDDVYDEDEDEEDEHLASTDAAVFVPTVEPISPPEGTEPVIPPPSTNITTTGARITVRLQASIPFPPEAEVERLLAMPIHHHHHLPRYHHSLQGSTWLASTQALIEAVTIALPSPPLPPPLYIPPPVDRRDDIPETELPPRKKSCLFALGLIEIGYGIRDTYVDLAEAVPEIAPMTLGEVNNRVTELAELYEHDTQDLYALLEDAHDSMTHISQRVTRDSQRVDLLMKDRIAHRETILIVEEEAYASREAWAYSIGLSRTVYYEVQTHCEQVYAHESQIHAHHHSYSCRVLLFRHNTRYMTRSQMQQTEMAELRETDHRCQAQMVEIL
nr:hypothetical protein [Tanacetum cinerariifolium]